VEGGLVVGMGSGMRWYIHLGIGISIVTLGWYNACYTLI